MADAQIKITADTAQAERALGKLSSQLNSLISVVAVTALAKQFIDLSDAATNLQNKLNLVVAEGQNSSQLFGLMTQRANMLGVATKDLGDLYFRIAMNTKDLALSQSDTLRTTELLMKGFQLTGMSAADANSATIQLGQAFSVGTLRGDELNSVMERLPIVAQALADKFGVQRGALKALGEAGKISSQDLYDAIQKSGTALDEAFTNKLPTIQNAFNVLSNTFNQLAQQTNENTGVNQVFAYALLLVADAVISVYEWFQKWGKVILYTIEIVGSLFIAFRAFKLIMAIWEGVGAAIGFIGVNLKKLIGIAGPVLAFLGFNVIEFNKTLDDLFSTDKTTMAEKYNQKLKDINQRLGVDNIAASKAAGAASTGLTAQQIKDADAIKKATISRNEELRKIIRDQEDSLALTKLEGIEGQVQAAINAANKNLIKEIKNDKGEIIAYTKGLNAEEEKTLRLKELEKITSQITKELALDIKNATRDQATAQIQNLDLRQQQAAVDALISKHGEDITEGMRQQAIEAVKIRQATEQATASMEQQLLIQGKAQMQSGTEKIKTATGVIAASDPRLAMVQDYATKKSAIEEAIAQEEIKRNAGLQNNYSLMIAAKTNLDLEYRNAKEIADIEFENRELLRAQAHGEALMALQSKIFEAKKLQEIQSATGTQFGYETQKAMAKEAADFEKKSTLEKTQMGIDSAVTLFSALGQQNRKAFEASKALNIAQAMMNAYMAASKALATYPFPFNIGFAAAAFGLGLLQVNAIRAQQYTGKKVGGGVSSGTPYIVGENGPEMFTPSSSGQITPTDKLMSGGGVTNVNFTIVANDTQGFDQLLSSRKGVIQQIISDAMLERGQRSIV